MHAPLSRALPVALVGLALFTASASAACDNSWTGTAADGQWTTQGNWSLNHLPTSAENACIVKAGTYTVTLASNGGSVGVKSLTIGDGAASGKQTLAVLTSKAQAYVAITVLNDSSIGANGGLLLDQDKTGLGVHEGNPPNLGMSGTAVMTNAGTITSRVEGVTDLRNELSGTYVNSGTIQVQSGELHSGSITNTGTVKTAAGAKVFMNPGVDKAGFVNDGTVANDGVIALQSANFKQNGTIAGNPVTMQYGTLTLLSGGGAFVTGNTVTLTGTVGAGETVTMGTLSDTDTNLVAAAGLTVAPGGTISMEGRADGSAELKGGPIVNNGTIRLKGFSDSYRARLWAAVTNNGTIELTGASQTLGDGQIANHGTMNFAADANLLLFSGKAFTTDGTLNFALAGDTAFGRITSYATKVGTLAGTVNGVASYSPAVGTVFKVIDAETGGGAFGAVGPGFTVDYGGGKYVSLIAGAPVGGPGPPAVLPVTTPLQSTPGIGGAPPVRCVVPDLKGKTLTAAKKALKKAHCALGTVKRPKAKPARRKATVVKAQSPTKGKKLTSGAKVGVTLGAPKKTKG